MFGGFWNQQRQIWDQLTPQTKRRAPGVIFLILLVSLLEMGAAAMLGLLGASMTGPQFLTESSVAQSIFVHLPFLKPIAENPIVLIPVLLAGVAASILLKNILTVYSNWSQALFGGSIVRDIGSRLFQSYLGRPYTWHLGHNVANLQTHLGWCDVFYTYFSSFFTVITSLSIAICLLILTLALAPMTAFLVFGITGIAALLVHKATRGFIRRASQRQTELIRQQNETSLAGLQGFREVLIFRLRQAFTDRYVTLAHNKACALASAQAWQTLPPLAIEATGAFTLLAAGILLLLTDASLMRLTGTLTLIAAVSWRLLPMANRIVSGIASMGYYQPYMKPVLAEIMQTQQSSTSVVPQDPSSNFATTMQRNIELKQICFRYPTAERDSLQDISLSIAKGSMVGIIGTSGAGKSTLVAILTGLLSPDSGQVLLDGAPLDEQRQQSLGSLLGYVPQSSYLLDTSLAENIAFKDWGQPIDYSRVEECCRLAAIDFLDSLPNGLDTEIGERGIRLSGGQVQRIIIARALYHHPQIMLFDEATSALDSGTEAMIQKTILSLRQQMTVIIVAHRLSTVESCDILYWMENGTIRAFGPPEEILPLYTQSMNTP